MHELHKDKFVNLYANLMALVANSNEKGFFYKDVVKDDQTYRIFNYHIPRTKAWEQADALNCRGTMFNITDGNVVLTALPMPKFFNWQENQFSRVEESEIHKLYPKLDGSLMSSFMHKGELWIKSKTEMNKDLSVRAMYWLKERPFLYEQVKTFTQHKLTVDFEFTGPSNSHIVQYDEDKLTILMLRSQTGGDFVMGDELNKDMVKFYPNEWDTSWAVNTLAEGDDVSSVIHTIPNGDEGYVALTKDRQLVKVKSDWYTSQHLTLGDTSNNRLWSCVLAGSSDDAKALLIQKNLMTDDILQRLIALEEKYNRLLVEWDGLQKIMPQMMHLDKKSFVMQIKEQYPDWMPLAILMFENKPVDVDTYIAKKFS